MKKVDTKKILKIVGDVLFGIFMVLVLFFALTNVRAKTTNGIPNLFGHGYLNVLSDSMDGDKDDSFKIGDLVFVRLVKDKEDANNFKENQIITYYTSVNGKMMIVSHRIVEVGELIEGGEKIYKTQGDHKDSQFAAPEAIYARDVLAVYEGKWEGAGTVFAWFSSGFGFFLIVVVPCILFLIFEIINFVKVYMEYKAEKQKVVTAGGPDSIENKIRLRKEAFNDLVKDGTLTQEQADAALNDYIKSLVMTSDEAPKASTEDVVEEVVEEVTEEVVTEDEIEDK